MSQHVEQDDFLDAVAVVGLAGRFPGARSVDELWRNLRAGAEGITFFSKEELIAAGNDPAQVNHPGFIPAKGILHDAEMFDAAFFGFNPREAEIMDPQTRHFLETAWEALESAGYDSERYDRPIGVFAGGSASSYLLYGAFANPQAMFALGMMQATLLTSPGFLSTWTSYKLNLTGPSVNVSTACSSGLVAIHLAAQALLNGECAMALAGSCGVASPVKTGYVYEEGGIYSDDGHTRSFDAQATGTVSGSGAGVVVLKRYEDAVADGDTIHAVIRGSAINNDGTMKIGFTAPSVDGQAQVIAEAAAVARVDPATIGFVECHGSATPLGDPIEVAALTQAFKGSGAAPGSVAIGSIKSNIGHLDSAAGTTGFIKTVLALRHGELVPSLNYRRPNPNVDFSAGPFYVNTELRAWERNGHPRRAGVSSFGIGGTNAHVVLEEAPPAEPSAAQPWQLVVLSARTATAADRAMANLLAHLRTHPQVNLADVAWTLQQGRREFPHRRAFVARDTADAIAALSATGPGRVGANLPAVENPPVVFAFSSDGAAHPGAGRELYETEPVFRREVDACAALLQPRLGIDLRTLLFAPDDSGAAAEQLQHPRINGPAVFTVSYALARLWQSWGVEPAALVGHGVGEYVAAVISGVMPLKDALALVDLRGELLMRLPLGTVLVVPRGEEEVRPLLEGEVMVAVVDTPAACVLSGANEAVEAVEARLAERGVECTRVMMANTFQPALMDGLARALAEQARQVQLRPPRIPFVSCITGTWITPAEATDPAHWGRLLRDTVRFSDAARELFRDPDRVLLEVGPGAALLQLLGGHPERPAKQMVIASLLRALGPSDRAALLGAVAGLWLTGRKIDWARLHPEGARRRVPLPTYPFERQRFWIDPLRVALPAQAPGAAEGAEAAAEASPAQPEAERAAPARTYHPRPNLQNEFVAPRDETEGAIAGIWQELFGISPIGVFDNFFELGGQSLLGTQVVSRVRSVLEVDIPVRVLFEGPTIAELAAAIARGDVQAAGALEAIQRVDRTDAEDLLARIDDLSEEEMEALLAQLGAEQELG